MLWLLNPPHNYMWMFPPPQSPWTACYPLQSPSLKQIHHLAKLENLNGTCLWRRFTEWQQSLSLISHQISNNHPTWWPAAAVQYPPLDNAMKKLPYNNLLLRITEGIVWIALEANNWWCQACCPLKFPHFITRSPTITGMTFQMTCVLQMLPVDLRCRQLLCWLGIVVVIVILPW
jgi:hypothetical protein